MSKHSASRDSGAAETGRDAMTLDKLCERMGHDFYDMELLRRAITHPSYRNESSEVEKDNQRLEFLGDSVLGLVVAERLFRAIHGADEGHLTQLKAYCVSEPALAEVARRLRLGELLRLGRGERRKGGARLSSVLADAMEAVLGAVLIDGGYVAAAKVIGRVLQPELAAAVGAGLVGRETTMQARANPQGARGPGAASATGRRRCRSCCRTAGARRPTTRSPPPRGPPTSASSRSP